MKGILIALLVLGVAIVAVMGFEGSGSDGVPTYVTAKIERGKLRRVVTTTGTLHAVVSVDVGSQLSGQIEKIHVDFNDTVKANQPLAQLDQQSYLASVSEARAALEVANANVQIKTAAVERARSAVTSAQVQTKVLAARKAHARAVEKEASRGLERKRALQERGTITDDVLDQAQGAFDRATADLREAVAEEEVQQQAIAMTQADLRQAEADLLNANARIPEKEAILQREEINLERTIVRSPIDGVVIGRDVNEGQTVAVSLEAPRLFAVAQDLHNMEVHARVDEADIGQLKAGQQATFTVDSFPDVVFEGRVVQIRKAPQLIQNVVTYTVVVATSNPDLILLPGMTALVKVVVMESGEVLKIPSAALRYAPKTQGLAPSPVAPEEQADSNAGTPATVWVLDAQGRPAPVSVYTGISDSSSSELVSGPLSEGDETVVNEIPAPAGRRFFGIRIGF